MKRARDRWRQNIIVQVSSHEVPERSWQRGVEVAVHHAKRVLAGRFRGGCTSCKLWSGYMQLGRFEVRLRSRFSRDGFGESAGHISFSSGGNGKSEGWGRGCDGRNARESYVQEKSNQSWVEKAKDKKRFKKYEIKVSTKDGKHKVEIPDEVLTDSTPLWEYFVVGKFLDLAPHVAKVHMVVNKIWSYGDSSTKVDVYEVNATTMRFRVSSSKAREKILKQGMWNIAEIPMVVMKWTPLTEEERQEETTIPMWVHLRKIEFSKDGKEFTVGFHYPWLPSKCNLCEKWGHTEKVCVLNGKAKKKNEGNSSSPMSGSGKKTP
ncbi:hypothetical protein Bca101_026008 [Brassica carinata]